MLNALWVGFFVAAFLIAAFKLLVLGDAEVFAALVKALFDSSKSAFEIALGLTGVMTLWLGVMKVGERAGMLELLTRWPGAAVQAPVSRSAGQSSGARRDDHEHGRQHAGAGQRRHAARHQGDAGTADPQPHAGYRQRRADPVPGDQHRLGDPAAGDHLHLSRAARRGRPDRRVRAAPDHHLYRHAVRTAGHRHVSSACICGTASPWRIWAARPR